MKKLKYCTLLLLIIGNCSSLFSQLDVDLAKKVKEIFPEEKIVNTSSSNRIDLKFDKKKDGKLVGQQIIEEEFISLASQQQLSYAVFYDDYSNIKTFKGEPHPRVNDTYYQSDDIFHSDARLQYANVLLRKFGSQASLTVAKEFLDVKYITKFYFPGVYSCLEKELTFAIHDGFEVELKEMNFEGADIQKTVTQEKGATVYTFKMKQVDKYSKDGGLPGSSHIYPHILVLIKGFENDKFKQTLFPRTDELYGWYHSLVKGVNNDVSVLKSLLDEILEGAETEEEKVANIFYWVQNNIRYIAFEDGLAGYQPAACQEVYHNRYGDCKGMANLTKELLILAGFDARLVWLGTRTIAYDYSIPSMATDNHMICALKQGEEFVYLDATEKFMNVGEYAERIQGQNVLIEDGDSFILAHIPSKDFSQNLKKIDLNLTLNDQSELVGTTQIKTTGEARTYLMYYLKNTPGKKQEELHQAILKGGESMSTVSDIAIAGNKSGDKELTIKGEISMPNKISSFDDEYYLYLNPYQYYANYDFEKDRKFDYWFDYKENNEINIEFEVPTGFKIESIPEPFNATDEEYSFAIKYEQKDAKIIYQLRIEIPKAMISQQNITGWNQVIKKLNDYYGQPIILKKM